MSKYTSKESQLAELEAKMNKLETSINSKEQEHDVFGEVLTSEHYELYALQDEYNMITDCM